MATERIELVGVNKTQKAFNEVQKSMGRLETNTGKAGAAFSKLQNIIVGAVAAVGAFKLSKDFLNTAVEVENLAIQLKFLTGSAEEGSKAFDTLVDFAADVPFQLQEIANSAPLLLTVTDSAEELQQVLKIAGDIAAATGLDFRTTAEQLQRSFSGGIAAADLFREKGVKSLLGFEEGVRFSAAETKKHIIDAFESGEAVMLGASKEMANTFTGTLSMIGDKFFKFKVELMDSGPFDFFKAMLKSLNNFLDSRFGDIESAAETLGKNLVHIFQAATIGLAKFGDMITPIVKIAVNAVKGLIDLTNSLPPAIKTLGIIGFLMLGIKGKLVVLAIGAVFDKVRLLFADLMDFMASGKEKIAGIMDALGFDGIAKNMRANAADIRSSNQDIRDSINKTKDEITTDTDDIILQMGKFGEMTEQELSEAGPLVQALAEFYKDLNIELEKTKKIQESMSYKDPIIAMGEANAKLLEEQAQAEEKAAKKQLFIAQQQMKKKLEFKRLETEGVMKFEEKMRKKELFIATQNHKRKMEFHRLESEGVKKFNEENISYLQAYTDGFKSQIGEQKTVLEQLNDAGAMAFNTMADALTDFVMTGKFKFKDFANMIIRELVRIAAQAAITFALKKLAGSFFGIPFLADGGPVQQGKPYVVGEEGPELFVPGQSGQVIPNDQMSKGGSLAGGGKAVTINFQVTALDADSFSSKLEETKDTIVALVNDAVTDGGRSPITA